MFSRFVHTVNCRFKLTNLNALFSSLNAFESMYIVHIVNDLVCGLDFNFGWNYPPPHPTPAPLGPSFSVLFFVLLSKEQSTQFTVFCRLNLEFLYHKV